MSQRSLDFNEMLRLHEMISQAASAVEEGLDNLPERCHAGPLEEQTARLVDPLLAGYLELIARLRVLAQDVLRASLGYELVEVDATGQMRQLEDLLDQIDGIREE